MAAEVERACELFPCYDDTRSSQTNEAQLRGCHQHERWKLCCSTYARFSYTPRKSSLNRALQVDSGFLEAIVRGYKAGILSQSHYANLTQCESLEGASFQSCVETVILTAPFLVSDFRTQLSATDYGNFLANEPLPLSTSTIADRATGILVDQFNYIRTNAVAPLSKFLEYITSVCDSLYRESS